VDNRSHTEFSSTRMHEAAVVLPLEQTPRRVGTLEEHGPRGTHLARMRNPEGHLYTLTDEERGNG
jgi:hypothetical protein